MPLGLVLSCVISACQSAPPVKSQSPQMPVCLESIPEQDLFSLLTEAMTAFESSSSDMPPVPAMGAEQIRLCAIAARDSWPK